MENLFVPCCENGLPIVPFDCNPESEDQGMLVYRSWSAAIAALEHQQKLYSIEGGIVRELVNVIGDLK